MVYGLRTLVKNYRANNRWWLREFWWRGGGARGAMADAEESGDDGDLSITLPPWSRSGQSTGITTKIRSDSVSSAGSVKDLIV